jgi:hypothetical protein
MSPVFFPVLFFSLIAENSDNAIKDIAIARNVTL